MKNMIIAFCCFVAIHCSAQPYVTIPDPNFVTFLQTNYPTCMSGNSLNTTCNLINTTYSINVSGLGITDLTGLQYFSNLSSLNCANNALTQLPPLPAYLQTLVCNNNSISAIQAFPFMCGYINCSNNLLGYLPPLPTTPTPALNLYCGNNNITCFPSFPNIMTSTLDLLPNPAICLPNYVPNAMNATLLAMPICSVGNIYNCPGSNAISGNLYRDANANCIKDQSDLNIGGIPLKLYNNSGSLIAQYYSQGSAWSFNASAGTYSVVANIGGLPVQPQCAAPGIDSSNIVLSIGNPSVSNINFNFDCNGFDIACSGVHPHGYVFPGQQHWIDIGASQAGGINLLNCGAVNGQVFVSVSGPASITSVWGNALAPVIAGNSCTYTINNFSVLPLMALNITTFSTAVIGNTINVSVTISPIPGDINLANNTYTRTYSVGNSYDPNHKDVFPKDVLVGFQDWFNYRIDFQNLGNAPAFNIRVLDTLDSNLDLSSLEMINSSHYYNVSVNNNIANFFFPNIMLADSLSDPLGSMAYVKYRIKPKTGLPAGTKIKNRAHIYFDYNPAVITNQTINNFLSPTSIQSRVTSGEITIYPNPAKDHLYVQFQKRGEKKITLTDVMGKTIFEKDCLEDNCQIDLEEFSGGVYFVKIATEGEVLTGKILIEK